MTVSVRQPVKRHDITPALLERCLDRVALAISRAGPNGTAYLPIFERLERELHTMRSQEELLARAKRRLKR